MEFFHTLSQTLHFFPMRSCHIARRRPKHFRYWPVDPNSVKLILDWDCRYRANIPPTRISVSNSFRPFASLSATVRQTFHILSCFLTAFFYLFSNTNFSDLNPLSMTQQSNTAATDLPCCASIVA